MLHVVHSRTLLGSHAPSSHCPRTTLVVPQHAGSVQRLCTAGSRPLATHAIGDSHNQSASSDDAGSSFSDQSHSHANSSTSSSNAVDPRTLTTGIQAASSIGQLGAIWDRYQQQFNAYHFSALLQQLSELHERVASGVARAAAQEQRQQQDQQRRSDSLAELEQELGHLLGGSDDRPGPDAAAAAANTPGRVGNARENSSSSGGRGSRQPRTSKRGLADLCPALDGYEHLSSVPASSSSSKPQQLRWRSAQQPQPPTEPIPAADAGAATVNSTMSPTSRLLQQQQLVRPRWQPPAGSGSSSSNSNGSGQQRPKQQQQRQPLGQSGGTSRKQQAQAQEQAQEQEPCNKWARQERKMQRMRQLALTAAAAALAPDRVASMDHAALAHVAHSMAKMQLRDASILWQLLQALAPEQLSQLDAHKLPMLLWSVGCCVSNARQDTGPYRLLLLPQALRPAAGPMVPAVAAGAAIAAGTAAAAAGSSTAQQGRVSAQQGPGSEGTAASAAAAASSLDDDQAQPSWSEALADAFCASLASSSNSNGSTSTGSSSSRDGAVDVPRAWLTAAADRLLPLLPHCSSQGVAMALWGFAQLGFSPPTPWWQQFWVLVEDLPQQEATAQTLALLMCAIGKLGLQVPPEWLSSYCSAVCDVLPSMSSQQLTMTLWGLACAGATPHKAFALLWFLTSMGKMHDATTQELSMWLYSLASLRITPSPTWCASFVEASFEPFTAPHTRPQDLVTAMWSISRLGWAPPLLYWRGLMEAARAAMAHFSPQDMANCISAAAAVDASCVSEPWLTAFIKTSQPLLSAFEPVQLAHTINALATLAPQHSSAHNELNIAWQTAFVKAAQQQLVGGRFSSRNLAVVVSGVRMLRFQPSPETKAFMGDASRTLVRLRQQEAARTQQAEQRQQQEAQAQ